MASSQQFSVTLPDEMAALVRRKVASGEYANESEVIHEGLRALSDREQSLEDWLREDVAAAYDEYLADPSTAVPFEEVRAKFDKRS